MQTWKCEACGKKFSVGEWMCADGQSNHTVETREFLLNDAPTDPDTADSLRDGRTRICNIPPDKKVMQSGEVHIVPGGYVEFIRGRFSTNNPEIQYYLDKLGGFCTKEQWDAVWLSREQRQDLKDMQLRALEQRLENERNELLAQTKQRVTA